MKNILITRAKERSINMVQTLENEGFLPLHDKSDPNDIKYKLGLSKKAFKSAVGGLFRQKLITISDEGISLNQLY